MSVNTIHTQDGQHLNYRPDIDGLRAIAVLAVVGFHTFPKWVPGGFIGVDVFFVISGYLISTILFGNLENGSFSFIQFYSRRIKRIFPALILVLVSCFVFGWFALLADEYRQLGRHIAGGASFLSNFFLWNESGYFDKIADLKPLLHLWSLGIEEQFYIIWPLLLWMAFRYRVNFLALTIGIALISFAINLATVYSHPVTAFYSPLSRFWELLIGAILAYIVLFRQNWTIRLSKSKNPLSTIGLVPLITGIALLSKTTPFPGWQALIPTLGAALLIFAGPKAWFNQKILSNPLLVWFGLISFPLYLWHWPLLSFARITQGEVHWQVRLTLVVISIILAWATYILVERPIRFGGHGKLKTIALIVLMIICGFVGYNCYQRDGLSFRENAQLTGYKGDIGHHEFHKYIAENFYPCTPKKLFEDAEKYEGYVRCAQSKNDSNVDIALIGDSHAEHLFIGLAEALPNKNIAYYIKSESAIIESTAFRNIYSSTLSNGDIHLVILAMSWNYRLQQKPAGSVLEEDLVKTIDALIASGKRVVLIDDVPRFEYGPEKCKGIRWLSRTMQTCEIDIGEANRQNQNYSGVLNYVVKARPDVKILKAGQFLCSEKNCNMTKGNKIFYRDIDHLNIDGSLFIGQNLVKENFNTFE